ncbi:hypothetical protein CVT25_012940 [Psilocybe cyanescens]|uniref:Uncharacterized protein n=1 Tax=Psilocybe cyanescens TaxID=93625 RepID=A0A409XTF4_PSICY|nr:hypothetical protein CVT25_012940 [Psilocybe cyanescens]
MHLGSFNLANLLVSLWHGQLDNKKTDSVSAYPWAVLRGNIWEQHGKAIAEATPYLPGSFDRPPCNIAKKINSEWLLYLYGLAPPLLYGVLPEPYYLHFCKLVRAMRTVQQHCIDTADLNIFSDHLHMNSKHFIINDKLIAFTSHSCFTAPCTRGDQAWPTNLFFSIDNGTYNRKSLRRNLAALKSVNALTAMIPTLQHVSPTLPHGGIDLGNEFALLHAQDRYD